MAAQVPGNAIETLKELLGIDNDPPGGGADEDKKTVERPSDKDVANPLGLFEQVQEALARYRSTVTWIVGAYAAVWTILIGTAPFAGLGDLTGWSLVAAGGGLFVAGIGAMLGIYAASRVLEPEDASLGELKLRTARDRPPWMSDFFKRVRWYLADGVESEANTTMWKLFREESQAYFGSDRNDAEAVGDLIETLDTRAKALREEQAAAAQLTDPAKRKEADGKVAAAQIAYDESLQRRERALAVAVTYEVRGKYLGSRRQLLVGALLVLVGALGYLTQVVAESGDSDDKPAAPAAAAAAPATLTPVQVRLKPSVWTKLDTTSGQQGCIGDQAKRGDTLPFAAYLKGDATSKGPWTLIVTPQGGAACRPVEITVKPPDARLLAAPATTGQPPG